MERPAKEAGFWLFCHVFKLNTSDPESFVYIIGIH